MPKKLYSLLTIAGSDPMGGAGIQADIHVGQSLGLHVMTAITVITAQNSHNLTSAFSVSTTLLKDQLQCIFEDVYPDAIKIGMIGSLENIFVIKEFLKDLQGVIPIVLDPVTVVSVQKQYDYGYQGLYLQALKKELFPLATVVTPNLNELQILTNKTRISSYTLADLNAKTVVIKGGHSSGNIVKDILITHEETLELENPRIKCENLHGTGCVFSSFMASYMALGDSLETAFIKTNRKLNNIISRSCDYRLGQSSYGPLNVNENYYCI